MMKSKKLLFATIGISISLIAHADLNDALGKLSGTDYDERQDARDELYSMAADVSSPDATENEQSDFSEAVVNAVSDQDIDKQGKIFLTRILARIGTEDAVPPLLKIASDPNQDPDIRDQALMAVSTVPGMAVTNQLILGLKEADQKEKLMWWQAIARQATPEAVGDILKQVGKSSISGDRDGWVALGKVGGSEAAGFLFGLLGKVEPGDSLVLEKALLETSSCNNSQLKKIYDSASDPGVKTGAFVQLADRSPKAALTELESWMQKKSDPVRKNIIRTALDSGNQDFWDVITSSLDNLQPLEISTVIAAIGDYNRSGYEGLVIEHLETGLEEIQLEALRALAAIGTEKSTPVLLDLMDSSDESIQDLAIYALSQVKDPQLDERILNAVQKSGSENRGLMIRLLAIRNSNGATDILNNLLSIASNDPDADEIYDAIEEVGNINTCRILLNGIISTADASTVRQYQLVLKRLAIRLAINDQLWDLAFDPALRLAWSDDGRANVIEILDCLSSDKALQYCVKILKQNKSPALEKAALNTLKRWTELNVSDYWISVIKDEDSSEKDVRDASAALTRLIRSSSVQGGGSAKASMAQDIIMDDDIAEDIVKDILDAMRSNNEVKRQFTRRLDPYKEILELWDNE